MSGTHAVLSGFWAAFILDLFIMAYAFRLSKRMGAGLLTKTTMYAGFAALVFGLHHILEVFLEETPTGIAIAEGVEGVAAILLLMAVFQLYKVARGD